MNQSKIFLRITVHLEGLIHTYSQLFMSSPISAMVHLIPREGRNPKLIARLNGNKKPTHNILSKIQALAGMLHEEWWPYCVLVTQNTIVKALVHFVLLRSTLFPIGFCYEAIQHKKMIICPSLLINHKELFI